MSDIKKVAQTMDVKEFKKRFTQEKQGFKDNNTGKIHFCIYDFGFNVDQEDCLEIRDCKVCSSEAMDYLKFRAEQRKQGAVENDT